MKKVILIICLMLTLLVSGCGKEMSYVRGIPKGTAHQQNLPFLPNEVGILPLWMPGICLAIKNINEVNAIMEAEKKADAEFGQLKNPIYFIKRKETVSIGTSYPD